MTADWSDRRRRVADALRLCLTGRTRPGVLGYAPAIGLRVPPFHLSRWAALPSTVARAWRARPERGPEPARWVLAREAGGWAVRPAGAHGAAPAYFTALIPVDEQNAAFDWASEITPDVGHKEIRYSGPPPA